MEYKNRKETPKAYKWDLTAYYKDDKEWEKDYLKIIKEFEDFNLDTVKAVLETTIPPKKQDLLKANLEAITAGYNY